MLKPCCFDFYFSDTPHTQSLTLYLMGYPGLEFLFQLRDTMSLRTADLGSVCVRARAPGLTQTPQQSHPLFPLHEPLHWRAERDPKACFLCSPSTEGRVVGLYWAQSKPKGPKLKQLSGLACLTA